MGELTFLRRPEVLRRTGLCNTVLKERVRSGTFPSAVTIAPQTKAWVEAEVIEWMQERIAERDASK